MRYHSATVFGISLIAALAASATARAQNAVADFYHGKQINLVIASSAGGGYDLYGRLVARYIGKYIPGNPNVIPSNMPGAGGNTASAYIANIAPKDGSVIGATQTGSLVDQLISVNSALIKHDARLLKYVGSANSEVFTCLVNAQSPIKSFDELFTREVILGTSGGTTRDMPVALKNILGAKLRFVHGYPGTREIGLAIEKNEVSGICGMGWTSIQSQRPEWFEKKLVRVLVQESATGDPELNKQGVPLSVNYAKSPEQRQMLDLLYAQGVFTRPFIMAPETPPDRLAAVRDAFVKALKDPQAIADAEKQKLVITIISGAELEDMVRKIYATPASSIAALKKALETD
ncbi:tripartite tricarboxylate transporter substrate-binding protein [Roseiarcaceae bacterium H3SJ34-1]|uniref:Bug family tripartite tricarboxylate transporter substrate binding protein n=1 Tax=Terripilifer ovatus TaxID=3032367 RepID=UPI003AB95809|nr:tripartite tricarboxylate transporter substrate-binding protein [Roseiarcaceae bacterium H3SJ34-1]